MLLLSDGYIANGSEPWLLPEVADLPDLQVEFATAPNGEDGTTFLPYLRDPATLARPWAVPGTPGLEHRIGGLEKADKTGDISYDPANHDFMVRTRAARIEAIEVPDVEVDDPDGTARVLVLGWGSTYGPIGAACRALRQRGLPIAQAHLRHLNPMPSNLGRGAASRYERVVIPEMNLGQLAHVIRGRYLVDAIPYNQVRGLPFTSGGAGVHAGGRGEECLRTSRSHVEADREGLQVRPGGPLVPRLRGLRDPGRGAELHARAGHPEGADRLRLRHRLLVAVPVLHGHLRPALDPRPGAGDRDRPVGDAGPTCRSGWSPATATRCRSAATT